ncbi:hypothetical protein F4825DRAFT_407443, partial [Nemania diffusa]
MNYTAVFTFNYPSLALICLQHLILMGARSPSESLVLYVFSSFYFIVPCAYLNLITFDVEYLV